MTTLLLLAAAISGGGFADLDAVDRQVAAFTGASVGQPGGAVTPVDRRLRLQPCRSGLALGWRTSTQDNVVVQCGDPNGWRLFVPVRRAPVAAAEAAPVAAITRGDAISIAVTGEGFTVSQPGEALESGPVGAWIKVRPAKSSNPNRNDTMRARIERPGLVSVPLD